MKSALFLTATFTAALGLALLSACSDDPGDSIDCSIECDDCFVISEGGVCVCVELEPGGEGEPDVCPL